MEKIPLSSRQLRVLYVNYRMCFPFFVGGDGLNAHFILSGGSRFYNWNCMSLGVIRPQNFSRNDDEVITALRRLSLPFQVSYPRSSAVKKKEESFLSSHIRELNYRIEGYRCRMVESEHLIDELYVTARTFRPDIIVTAEEMSNTIVDVAYEMEIPCILRVSHAEWDPDDLADISSKVSLIVLNSQFLLQKYKHLLKCAQEVIFPVIDWKRWIVKHQSERYISMLNPVPEKGGDIFLKVVSAFPKKDFLAQEGWYRPDIPFEKYPNLTWQPRKLWAITKNMGMRYLLGNSRLLMVPSQWEETFGTIIIQAMKNSIPVIASHVGGIPETIGNAGLIIDEFYDPAAWVEAINYIDGHPQVYQKLQIAAYASAKRFSYQAELSKFCFAVEKLAKRIM